MVKGQWCTVVHSGNEKSVEVSRVKRKTMEGECRDSVWGGEKVIKGWGQRGE